MSYGVVIEEKWEVWMTEFNTLKEARAEVEKWRAAKGYNMPAHIALVRIMSRYKQGDLS